MYQKILVPLDGSESSQSVLKHVVTLAIGCKVPEVILLRVREPMAKHVRDALVADLEAEEYLSTVTEYLKAEGVDASTAVAAGDPADEILNYAHNNEIDLIIMSTHGKSGVSRLVFGSVADKVIRHSRVPVLLGPAPGSRK